MNKQRWKIAIYITIGLAALGALGLLWYFLGWAVASVAAALGIGGATGKSLERFAAARETELKANEKADLDAKTALAAVAIEAEKQREQLHSDAAKEGAKIYPKVNGATTQAQLDAVEDDELAKLEAMLVPIHDPGEDGYIRAGLVALMCLLALCLLAVCGSPVRAQPATDAAKARTLRVVKAMRKARVMIRELQIQLTAERQRHKILLRTCKVKAKASDKRHREQRAILLGRKPPPVWPHYVAAYGGASVLLAIGVGLCVVVRK